MYGDTTTGTPLGRRPPTTLRSHNGAAAAAAPPPSYAAAAAAPEYVLVGDVGPAGVMRARTAVGGYAYSARVDPHDELGAGRGREVSMARRRALAEAPLGDGRPSPLYTDPFEQFAGRALPPPPTEEERRDLERALHERILNNDVVHANRYTLAPGGAAAAARPSPPQQPASFAAAPAARTTDDDPLSGLGRSRFVEMLRTSVQAREVRVMLAPKQIERDESARPTAPLSAWLALLVRAGLNERPAERYVGGGDEPPSLLHLTAAFCEPPEPLTADQRAAREALEAMSVSSSSATPSSSTSDDPGAAASAAAAAASAADDELANATPATFDALVEDRVRVRVALRWRPRGYDERAGGLPGDAPSLERLASRGAPDPHFAWSSHHYVIL